MNQWQALFFGLFLGLAGCTSWSETVVENPVAEPVEACVNVRNITSFDAIDDQHIYVKASGAKQHFLFTLVPSCIELRNAQTIAVENTMTRVCSTSFGKVIYRDLGRGLQSCRISKVEVAGSRAAIEQLVKLRQAARKARLAGN